MYVTLEIIKKKIAAFLKKKKFNKINMIEVQTKRDNSYIYLY